MIRKNHPGFPSDIFVILETVGASLLIADGTIFLAKKINNIGPISFLTTKFNINGTKLTKIYEFTSVLANTGTIKETSLSNFLGESMAEKVIVSVTMPKMASSDIIHTYKIMPGSQVMKPTCDASNLTLRNVVVLIFRNICFKFNPSCLSEYTRIHIWWFQNEY